MLGSGAVERAAPMQIKVMKRAAESHVHRISVRLPANQRRPSSAPPSTTAGGILGGGGGAGDEAEAGGAVGGPFRPHGRAAVSVLTGRGPDGVRGGGGSALHGRGRAAAIPCRG